MQNAHGDARSATDEALATAWKRQAGEAAAELVNDGDAVGLGTGSTARWATEAIGARLRNGRLKDVVGVPTSDATAALAKAIGIPLVTLAERSQLDICIDGADEVAPDLTLIKGGGGALVREKIVAMASKRMIVVADDRKLVARLATSIALPVAVVPFGVPAARAALELLGATVTVRMTDGEPFITDDGLYVLDASFAAGITAARDVETALMARPEIVTTGLFIGLAERAFVGGPAGVRELLPTAATGADDSPRT